MEKKTNITVLIHTIFIVFNNAVLFYKVVTLTANGWQVPFCFTKNGNCLLCQFLLSLAAIVQCKHKDSLGIHETLYR